MGGAIVDVTVIESGHAPGHALEVGLGHAPWTPPETGTLRWTLHLQLQVYKENVCQFWGAREKTGAEPAGPEGWGWGEDPSFSVLFINPDLQAAPSPLCIRNYPSLSEKNPVIGRLQTVDWN